MTYALKVIITHKDWREPLHKELMFQGDTFEDIMKQIETLPYHLHNLRHYRKTVFKDINGVKHSWKLEEVKDAQSA